MVLLEAMDAGCAIVTTNAEGCAEVVGDAGLVVPGATRRAFVRRSTSSCMNRNSCMTLQDARVPAPPG